VIKIKLTLIKYYLQWQLMIKEKKQKTINQKTERKMIRLWI
jgi:hypothetical protein